MAFGRNGYNVVQGFSWTSLGVSRISLLRNLELVQTLQARGQSVKVLRHEGDWLPQGAGKSGSTTGMVGAFGLQDCFVLVCFTYLCYFETVSIYSPSRPGLRVDHPAD